MTGGFPASLENQLHSPPSTLNTPHPSLLYANFRPSPFQEIREPPPPVREALFLLGFTKVLGCFSSKHPEKVAKLFSKNFSQEKQEVTEESLA